MSAEDHVFQPIVGVPRGMISTAPPVTLEQGYMAWVENYLLSRSSFQTRRGFEKFNPYSIPLSGLRFNGTDQYVEVPAINDEDSDVYDVFTFGGTRNIVVEIAFMLEEFANTSGTSDRRMFLATYGLTSASETVAHKWAIELVRVYSGTANQSDIIQVIFRVGTNSIRTAFTTTGESIKPGVGYRVAIVKDASLSSGTHHRLLVFRDGKSQPIANVTGTTFSGLVSRGRLMLGRSLITGLGANGVYFKGIIQDFRFWNYGIGASLPAFTNDEDPIIVRSDTELDDTDKADGSLKCWLRMDEADNQKATLTDLSGEGYHGVKKPGIPTWVTPGLIDNAPKTFAIDLDPLDSQFLRAKDRPSALGGSIFNAVRANTQYAFTVSMAFKVSSEYVDRLTRIGGGTAPDVLPLFYYGDDSSGASTFGDDYTATGNWAIALWLENIGTGSSPDYKARVKVQYDDDSTDNVGPVDHTIELGTKYRIDVVRDQGRYIHFRVYKDGEIGFAADGEEQRFDAGAGVATSPLEDSTWSNGEVFLIGTLNNSGTQVYFPGVIDDVRVFSVNAETVPAEYNTSLHPWDRLAAIHPSLVFYAMLNEGQGLYFSDSSSWNNNLSAAGATVGELHELRPAQAYATHGAGWIRPNRYLGSQGLTSYKDIETGTESVLAVAGGAIWQATIDDGVANGRFQALYHGLDKSRPMSFAHVGNQRIFADGINPNLRFDGKSMGELGILAPTNAPTLGTPVGSGNILAGTYTWVYTWKNSKTGGRSNPSPSASTTLGSGGESLNIRFYVPSDSLQEIGVDTVEIWRTKAGGAVYYFVDDVKIPKRDGSQATTGTVIPPYLDNTADASLGATVLTSITAYGRLPKVRYCLGVKGRLFGFGQDKYPNRIVWTELHFPDHHDPASQFSDDLDAGDGDEITGAVYANDLVYVFQRRHIWAISGAESEEAISIYLVHKGIGCVAHNTIQVLGGTVMFRGEDNFYALEPGSAQPVALGDDIKSLLELVDPSTVQDETSGIVRQESTYLCSVTSYASTVVNSNLRNDYIFAFHLPSRAWALWSLNGLGHFSNVELNNISQLYYLSRHGFVYKYSGRGLNNDTGGADQLTYVDGLPRASRPAFTLNAAVAADDLEIELNEITNVFTDGDGMKGLSVRYRLDDWTLSTERFIRKVVLDSGSKYRIFLTAGAPSAASIGNEVYVGGYLRKIITGDMSLGGNPFLEKTITHLAMVCDGNSGGPTPVRAPTVTKASGALSLRYGYTFEVGGDEGRMSPITTVTSAARANTVVEMNAPNRELGANAKIHVYCSVGSALFKEVDEIDASALVPGASVSFTDAGGALGSNYEPHTRNSVIELTGQVRKRDGVLATHGELDAYKKDLTAQADWRTPFRTRGSIVRVTAETLDPDCYHEIQGMALLLHSGEAGPQ